MKDKRERIMRRKIITLLFAATISFALCTSVMAEETINGFYDIGTETNVTITPYAGETQVTATEKNIDSDEALEKIYESSDRLEVGFSAATTEDHYGIILVEGTELPTKDTVIYYINQETANSASVDFNVYPKLPEETTDMMLYISSSSEEAELISIPVSYAVNASEATEEPTYAPGDANEDTIVDIKDVIAIRRFITGGYGAIINESAANVNGDAIIDIKDAIAIRRFITGGYGTVLQ